MTTEELRGFRHESRGRVGRGIIKMMQAHALKAVFGFLNAEELSIAHAVCKFWHFVAAQSWHSKKVRQARLLSRVFSFCLSVSFFKRCALTAPASQSCLNAKHSST